MLWRWPENLLSVLLVSLEAAYWGKSTTPLVQAIQWTTERKLQTRERTRDLWYHGFDHYMQYAFPLDELTPLSCTGRGPDWQNPANIAHNDVAGNYSLTLIDVLDTLVVLGDVEGFDKAVRNVIDWVQFDVNTKPQVFETTIRVLGGLLSGHLFADKTGQKFHLPWYKGELLDMAHDLGKRLLPAFETPTGIPYARINLRHGMSRGESVETCTAGAGSLIIEFATLSRLTGDDRFEKAARKAFFALWNRKSDIGLVGNTINTWTGAWMQPEITGIGAGIDSFYEYALKWYILSGEHEFLDVWQESYAAVMRYSRASDGYWFRTVNIHTGDLAYAMVDSLSAFWPGLQVLAGDVPNAIKSHLMYWNLWRRHSGLPEVWDINHRVATSFQYPLRPEFIESTWYLYRATRDPFYLDVGERILNDIIYRCKVECGLAGIQDLRTNHRDDRMESFALSETLKYLFLLFDEANPLHSDDSNYVLTTEGHILFLEKDKLKPISAARRRMRREENHQCPVYEPVFAAYDWDTDTGLTQGIRSRADVDYARHLTGMNPEKIDTYLASPDGWCEVPRVELYSYDFLLSADGQVTPEDMNPGSHKLEIVPDGYLLHNVSGVRTHIVSRLDGKGYDVTKLGPHSVRTGQIVYVKDPNLVLLPVSGDNLSERKTKSSPLYPDVQLRFYIDILDPMFAQAGPVESPYETLVTAYTSAFGADLTGPASLETPPIFGHGGGVRAVMDSTNPHGCGAYSQEFENEGVLVFRGECTFIEKLTRAKAAGASGVIIISNEELPINPSANAAEIAAAGNLDDAVMVVINRSAGELVLSMLNSVGDGEMGQLMLTVDPEGQSVTTEVHPGPEHTGKESQAHSDPNRVLYINGHALLNTRLLT
ncbi:glycoside hydrolase family 47 protein [Athelia psychrophila]|uniref:alpha-1,2-Mannosidase n=1 Tax=Athelia psychrophila TaxID=1759441 RepID=A0A166VMV4_9AGAM|nr:glycoside hydrolase family 47 protein [Fibularhizoctonia sp. CBS 109695]